MPGWGSWDWVGTFLVEQLGGPFRTVTFAPGEVPAADVVLVVKHAPSPAWVDAVAARAAVIYCPIDYYGAAAEIGADADWLRRCARVLVHCRRLLQHFAPLAPAAYVDHPLKYTAPVRTTFRPTGPVLWVGVRSNLPALVEWVNAHPLPAPLDVLTNPEVPGRVPEPAALGFRPDREVRVHEWSPERHRTFVERARAALDVKGDDFRTRHKPPAKALDFVASGLPLAMNPGTSPVEHLAALGLKVPSPLDVNGWLSERYWKETRRLGERLGRELAPERVARRFQSAVEEALAARPESVAVPEPPEPTPRPPVPAAPRPDLRLYGLLITKDDHPVFEDWCRDQLRFYDAVVCLDGSAGDETARAAARFGDKLVYLHERDFEIPHKTDHGLRAVVHDQIVARFGTGHWVMCCHADEFCYHDPRKIAAAAERGGFDQVSWFSPHFYPHPDEWPDWPWLRHLPVPERFAHYHWSYKGDGFPWCEDRLYRTGPGVAWDRVTHGNVRPNGLTAPAPFHPILRHYKVLVTDPAFYDVSASAAHYGTHWVGTSGRTGVPFPVREPKDLFVAAVKNYARCDLFDGAFPPAWDLGTEFRVDPPDTFGGVARRYREARALAARGDHAGAAERLDELDAEDRGAAFGALVKNDLAVLAAVAGDLERAAAGLRAALRLDPDCVPARTNLDALSVGPGGPPGPLVTAPPVAAGAQGPVPRPAARSAVRVAVISFLFNWPTTGGGNVHTAELTRFLAAAGYEVRHLYARFDPWGIGGVTAPTPHPAEPVAFTEAEWTADAIVARFRAAVDAFDPDWVVLTDSWNMKPVLAAAAGGRPFVLRLQALECLCPLNNVRLLPGADGRPRQCTRHQLATPDDCVRCVRDLERTSGDLHRAERALAGVGTPEYRDTLIRAFAGAAAVLAVNPLTAAMVEPHARDVRVVTSGMAPDRFPWPFPAERRVPPTPGRMRVLFAGLTHEWMKGFHVLRVACARLWAVRRDFEVVVTDAAPEDRPAEPWARYVGWQSQADLPGQMAGADLVVVPTVAQEALGRTAVEAMAAGKPVVASRIGGLPFTVTDGATGLLCAPNDPADLGVKLAALLDDPVLRARLGAAGRARFEEHYAWPALVERHYRPLFGDPRSRRSPAPSEGSGAGTDLPVVVEPATGAEPVGCVLAVRDRAADELERTLQTYRWQTVSPADRVLVDYGSAPEFAAAYRTLGDRYGWRIVRVDPAEPCWHLADAYNRAVAALDPAVRVVFKSDTDILLGPEVLAVAARRGAAAFCQFQYLTVPRDVPCPAAFADPAELRTLFDRLGKSQPSAGQGLFACPLDWFRRVGGFDRRFRGWGYEDHDLRARAELSLPVTEVPWREALLLHQWHPAAPDSGADNGNREYFERMRVRGEEVRNGGQLVPVAAHAAEPPRVSAAPVRWRVVVATRSMNADLYRLSGEFLTFDGPEPSHRVRVTDAGPAEYFRRLAALDADWVINLDEDAFVLDPRGLLALVRRMEAEGYAACGVPDGGAVPIRTHNPAACNAFFNVFDLRRCRAAWADWDRVLRLRHRPEYERAVTPFARGPHAYDDCESYYGAFFALRDAGERILPLEAETWRDGVTTLVRGPSGPLLLHAWHAHAWAGDPATRQRYEAVVAHARAHRAGTSGGPAPEVPDAVLARTLVGVVVYDRFRNVERWLAAWHRSEHGAARLVVIHNRDRPDPAATRAITSGRPDAYIPRANVGYDIGAFRDVVTGRFAAALPDWEYLLWCTDDFMPVRPDFLLRFLAQAADPRVGLVAGRYGYGPGNGSGLESERHCRTVGFLIRRATATALRFPTATALSREDCLSFEHRPGHLMEQVLARGERVVDIGDDDSRVMWDMNHESGLDRWPAYERHFGARPRPGAGP